ncbi:MAG TPA: DUF2637 domain-containing protein, partial [Streptomyces sp.]
VERDAPAAPRPPAEPTTAPAPAPAAQAAAAAPAPPPLPQPEAAGRALAADQTPAAPSTTETRQDRDSPTQAPPETPKGPSGWQRAGHAVADWIELRNRRRRAKLAKPADDEDSDITILALVVVSLVTFAVSILAFVLSFSMMLAAARLYGWSEHLAWLFPILIDAGAVGGTFMGAISSNRTYVRVGHSVLTLTLSASVLFNLVGHDVTGHAILNVRLPSQWQWTSPVAAVFIPVVLACFIHSFSKALKAFVDQHRARKAAAAAAAAAQQARIQADRQKAAELERKRQLEAAPAPVPAPAAPKATQATAPPPRPARVAAGRKAAPNPITKPEAVRIGLEAGVDTPAALRDVLTARGLPLPGSPTTLENWCKAIKEAKAAKPLSVVAN